MATTLKVEVTPINMRDAGEIERAVEAFARSSTGGLIMTPSPFAVVPRDLIIALAARHNLPSVYFDRSFVTAGGLMSYGPDILDLYQRAASYPERREAERSSGTGAGEVRNRTKPQNCQGARARRAGDRARSRRRGDRVTGLPCCDCSQLLMALRGPAKACGRMSGSGGEADPIQAAAQCLLLTRSGLDRSLLAAMHDVDLCGRVRRSA